MLSERQPVVGCRRRLRRKRWRVDACVGRDDAAKGLRGTPLIDSWEVVFFQVITHNLTCVICT